MTVIDMPNLEAVIAAWQAATARLEQTHAALRSEVVRLTNELAVKNRELARKNRLADLGQIASHVAHEVRNNLVPVALYAGLLRRRLLGDAAGLEVVEKLETGLSALGAMINDMLNFTADREPKFGIVRPQSLLDEVVQSLAAQLHAHGIAVEIDAAPTIVVRADVDALRRAVLNLVLNAIDAMPDGGKLTLTACKAGEFIDLEIADTGPGLSDEAQGRVFDPFFTTKPNGIGLGLAIVQRIVEAHGGRIAACNCPEGGAAFTLRLPCRHQREAAA